VLAADLPEGVVPGCPSELDGGHHLVRRHHGRVGAVVQLGGGDPAWAGHALDDNGRVQDLARQHHLTGRVRLDDRTSDRAAVADLAVADVADHLDQQRQSLGEQLGPLDRAVADQCPDDGALTVDVDVVEVVDLVDVDERVGAPQTHVEHRHEALAAGKHAGRAVVRVEGGHRVGDAGRPVVGEP
jgi:hypothetical protein